MGVGTTMIGNVATLGVTHTPQCRINETRYATCLS